MEKRKNLTIEFLRKAAKEFCELESKFENVDLYGITDGKAVGTYIEHKFQVFLDSKFSYLRDSSAKGIDLPGELINTDIKVTSIKQPQSSSPFRDAKQKIYGLGYNLLIFVYEKIDNSHNKTSKLDFVDCTFLDKTRTGDYTTTLRIREMLKDGANIEDLVSYLNDKNIPADEITLNLLAERILNNTPNQGYLTISNALQWRLQYGRVVYLLDQVDGINKIVNRVQR